MLAELQDTLRRKFTPAQQRRLDKLLAANNERALRPAEQKQLDELIAEYGGDTVEKARARYLLELSARAQRARVKVPSSRKSSLPSPHGSR